MLFLIRKSFSIWHNLNRKKIYICLKYILKLNIFFYKIYIIQLYLELLYSLKISCKKLKRLKDLL